MMISFPICLLVQSQKSYKEGRRNIPIKMIELKLFIFLSLDLEIQPRHHSLTPSSSWTQPRVSPNLWCKGSSTSRRRNQNKSCSSFGGKRFGAFLPSRLRPPEHPQLWPRAGTTQIHFPPGFAFILSPYWCFLENE